MAAPSSRWTVLWTRRKGTILWTAVAVLAIVLAVVFGVRLLTGATTPPHHFSFTFGAPKCGCALITQDTYGFPSQASVDFSWWVTWIGSNGSAELNISKSNGSPVYLAVSEYQQGNPYNLSLTWAQGGAGTFSGHGSPFTFTVAIVTLGDFFPPDTTIWINGTYTTPLL